MKYIWCRQRKTFIPADEFYGGQERVKSAMVHGDTMDAIRSEADGRMYDSKSRYRAELKARGCIEVGNERIHESGPKPIPDVPGLETDIKRSIHELS